MNYNTYLFQVLKSIAIFEHKSSDYVTIFKANL